MPVIAKTNVSDSGELYRKGDVIPVTDPDTIKSLKDRDLAEEGEASDKEVEPSSTVFTQADAQVNIAQQIAADLAAGENPLENDDLGSEGSEEERGQVAQENVDQTQDGTLNSQL